MPKSEVQFFVRQVFDDLNGLEADRALKIPLSSLPDSGINTINLLLSAARQRRMSLHARADSDFLYVWNVLSKSEPN